jgi:hypothetical protein
MFTLTNHTKLQTDKRMLKKRSAEGSTPSGSQSGSEQAYTPLQSQQSIMSGGPDAHLSPAAAAAPSLSPTKEKRGVR